MTEKKEEEIYDNIRLFHKLAGYYKWTYAEFKATPLWVLKQLCKILDEPGDDLSKFIGYEEYGEYRNLLRLHGSGDKS